MASFYIRTSGATGWIATIQEYSQGKKKQRSLTDEEYQVFSINRKWAIDEARQQVKRLNQLNKIETHKKSRAARQASLLKIQSSLYISEALANKFQEHLIENILSGDIERMEKNKILSHWQASQKIINTLQLLPDQYGANAGRFVSQFVKQSVSPDYGVKLLKIINLFGEFCCQYQNQYYRPIKFTRIQTQQIRDKYLSSKSYRGPSDRLTPELLEAKRSQLSDANYRWLYLSVWLGLRPAEINGLTDAKFGCKLEFDKKRKVKFVQVYQAKLKSVAVEKRWKYIPLIFREQEVIEDYIKLPLKQPTNQTLRKLFGFTVRGYAGRKNFTDLMLDRGRKIEEISSWLGHATIETTWKFYKDRNKLTLLEQA